MAIASVNHPFDLSRQARHLRSLDYYPIFNIQLIVYLLFRREDKPCHVFLAICKIPGNSNFDLINHIISTEHEAERAPFLEANLSHQLTYRDCIAILYILDGAIEYLLYLHVRDDCSRLVGLGEYGIEVPRLVERADEPLLCQALGLQLLSHIIFLQAWIASIEVQIWEHQADCVGVVGLDELLEVLGVGEGQCATQAKVDAGSQSWLLESCWHEIVDERVHNVEARFVEVQFRSNDDALVVVGDGVGFCKPTDQASFGVVVTKS